MHAISLSGPKVLCTSACVVDDKEEVEVSVKAEGRVNERA
jgi:hypothetical protein